MHLQHASSGLAFLGLTTRGTSLQVSILMLGDGSNSQFVNAYENSQDWSYIDERLLVKFTSKVWKQHP